MKSQPQKKHAHFSLAPQVTPFEDSENPDQPMQLQDSSLQGYNTVNVSQLVKSGNRALLELRSTATTGNSSSKINFQSTNKILNRSNQHTSKGSLQEDFENIDPTELAYRLKVQVHQLKKKEASHRLEISRLGKVVLELQEENAGLKQTIKNLEVKGTKDNQYILKLDLQVRYTREQMDRLKKQSRVSKITELQQQNEEMKFVIKQLLLELETLKKANSTDRTSFQKCQNIHELMKDLKTFPSSESSRKSGRAQNIFEFTMNPKAHKSSEQISKRELIDMMEDPDFQNALNDPQNQSIKRKVLSMINEQSENNSKAATQDFIKQRINEMASLSHISYEKNTLYRSQQ